MSLLRLAVGLGLSLVCVSSWTSVMCGVECGLVGLFSCNHVEDSSHRCLFLDLLAAILFSYLSRCYMIIVIYYQPNTLLRDLKKKKKKGGIRTFFFFIIEFKF